MGKLIDFLIRAEHKLYITKKRARLKNRDICILSSNCNGAYILHDMGCKFNTPTVNLYFKPGDFLKFVKDPARYLNAVPIETFEENISFPIGQLLDIRLYFMHYKSFPEAREKWNERSKRVKLDNVFVMMTDKDNCTYEQLKEFDQLPYQKKVVFTCRTYPEIKSAFYIPGFEKEGEVGVLSDWKPQFWRRRWLDDYDYVKIMNASKK